MAHIFSALPAHRLHTSQPLSADEALEHLSLYILQAENDPSRQPNAILTETGPISVTSSTSLVIHNLKRVQAGLRGEQLATDLSSAENGDDDPTDPQLDVLDQEGAAEAKSEKRRRRSELEQANMGADGWQEREEYEREQEGTIEGEIDDGMQGVTEGEEAQQHVTVTGTSKVDKEARKKAKKERNKAEKKVREKKRKAPKEG